MALSPRLEARQSQSLSLTPQLMQSIRLLQLSHLELMSFVETELLRNPLLEREDVNQGQDFEGEPTPAPDQGPDYGDLVDQTVHLGSADAIAEGFDTAVENVFPEQGGADAPSTLGQWKEGRSALSDAGEAPDLDMLGAAPPTLSEHLEAQVGLILHSQVERMIAHHLIDALDESGYLTTELASIADRLGATLAEVEAVLLKVQGCEPIGVFARGLAECLAIQLKDKNRLDPMMMRLLANLDRLAMHDMAGLARAVGADREDLADMLAELRALDPKPGRAFDHSPVQAVVPDVFVREGPDGGWRVELNGDILPKVLVNRTYYATVSRKTRDQGGRTFLSECLASASWLTKSLDQRAQTILKVGTEIARQQDAFLRHGVAHLRPMTLKMVADAIGMHESTVSRVTSSKYLSTPRGLFELKYFFTTAIGSSTGGEDHSAESVRHRIRQLIEAEPASGILSDDTIADLLKREGGIDLARRTVAKYRESMNIPSSVIRRRQKKMLVLAG